MNVKNTLSLSLSVLASAAFATVPTVRNVKLGGGATATVTYDLSGDPGIVTMEAQTNTLADLSGEWLPIDGSYLRNVKGDVSCLVQPGTGHKIKWKALEALGAPLKRARVVLTAWSTNVPPDYLVANLAGQDVPRYYTATNYFPLGFGHLAYKTTNIVFKLVKAKGCSFNAGEYEVNDSYAGKNPHVIHMTRDYYLGVYELTQAQYHWATGRTSPWNVDHWPTDKMYYDSDMPAGIGWHDNWRDGASWKDSPTKNSFCGGATAKTGLHVDLPTEAEWEFAARCGGYRAVSTQVVDGEDAADVLEVANVQNDVMMAVGSLKPNDWGFYDMIGNVSEMCLDWVHCSSGTTPDTITGESTDPHGLTSGGNGYVFRGGQYNNSYGYNSTARSCYGAGQNGRGCRAAVVIEEPSEGEPAVAAVSFGVSASPQVAEVKLGQNRANRNIVVSYALSKHAIVTWTLETNAVANATEGWVAVDESKSNARIFGDVNRLVEKTGACSFQWNPDETWADQAVAEGRARAVLTAWPTNHPPLYMVMDMVGPIVNYYTSTNALPGGLMDPLYRTRKMVFRKIPAKDVVWTMGVPEDIGDESYSQWSDANRQYNTPHKVKLTYDYYVAVNEMTCAQWGWSMHKKAGYGWIASNISNQKNQPVCGCYCDSYWNAAKLADTGTLVGRLRLYYGSRYPVHVISSAEWEYAYRAGEPKTLYTGKNWTWDNLCAAGNVNSYDEYRGKDNEICGAFDRFPPNRWGLYHMLGNKLDLTRDGADPLAYQNQPSYIETGIAVDPNDLSVGKQSVRGLQRLQWFQIQTGGYWTVPDSTAVNSNTPRLMCPIPKDAD